ncbi:MAG: nucleotidyltransferase domain-containing protein [Caldilineae bacterium]|nr:MAG: nucleotidyltransferase domain-containing protein [Caldilineae bacterium]
MTDRPFPSKSLAATLEKLKRTLAQNLGDNLLMVTLYGSHARGEASKDSDVDLLVVLKRLTPEAEAQVEQIVYKTMWEINFSCYLSLNLIDESHYRMWERHRATLLQNIKRDGQILWYRN